MKIKKLLLLCLLLLLFQETSWAKETISPSEEAALQAIYNEFIYPFELQKALQNPCEAHLASTRVVECYNGHVLELKLRPHHRHKGKIPKEIGNLTYLKKLELGGIDGPLPEEIGNLKNLEELNLEANENLSGTLPTSIGNLKKLKKLKITSSTLSGPLPSTIGGLESLEELHLTNNKISGSLPPEIGQLKNLQTLELQYNYLTGSIPEEIGNLKNLKVLNLFRNQFSGKIPESIGQLQQLKYLNLSSNKLSGTVPESTGNLNQLLKLNLGFNLLTGPVPETLGNLTQIQSIRLHYNQLSGTLPSSLGNLKKLSGLWLDNNQLMITDSAPEYLSHVENLFLTPQNHLLPNPKLVFIPTKNPDEAKQYRSVHGVTLNTGYFDGTDEQVYGPEGNDTSRWKTREGTGFKTLYNPFDPIIVCHKSKLEYCSRNELETGIIGFDNNNGDEAIPTPRWQRIRIYSPPGIFMSTLVLFTTEGADTKVAMRWGTPPSSTTEGLTPYDFQPLGDYAIKNIYPVFDQNYLTRAAGGHISLLDHRPGGDYPDRIVERGNWIYLNAFYSSQELGAFKYSIFIVDRERYKAWYQTMNDYELWDENGDPPLGEIYFNPNGKGIIIDGEIIDAQGSTPGDAGISTIPNEVDWPEDLKAGDNGEKVLNTFVKLRDSAFLNYHLIEKLSDQNRQYFNNISTPQEWMPIEEKGLQGGIKNDLAPVVWSNHQYLKNLNLDISPFWNNVPSLKDLLDETKVEERLDQGKFPYTAADINRLRDAIRANFETLKTYQGEQNALPENETIENMDETVVTEKLETVSQPLEKILSGIKWPGADGTNDQLQIVDSQSEAKHILGQGLSLLSDVFARTFYLEGILKAFQNGTPLLNILKSALSNQSCEEAYWEISYGCSGVQRKLMATCNEELCLGRGGCTNSPAETIEPPEGKMCDPENPTVWKTKPNTGNDERSGSTGRCRTYTYVSSDKYNPQESCTWTCPEGKTPVPGKMQCTNGNNSSETTPSHSDLSIASPSTPSNSENPETGNTSGSCAHFNCTPGCFLISPYNPLCDTCCSECKGINCDECKNTPGNAPCQKCCQTNYNVEVRLNCQPTTYQIGDSINCQWVGNNTIEYWTYLPEGYSIDDKINDVPVLGNINTFSPRKGQSGARPNGTYPSEKFIIDSLEKAKFYDHYKVRVAGSRGWGERREDFYSDFIELKSSDRKCEVEDYGTYDHGKIAKRLTDGNWYICWDGAVYRCTDDQTCSKGEVWEDG